MYVNMHVTVSSKSHQERNRKKGDQSDTAHGRICRDVMEWQHVLVRARDTTACFFMGHYYLFLPLKLISVVYCSQESHTGQLDFFNCLVLCSIKSNNVNFLNQIHYFSIKYLPSCPQKSNKGSTRLWITDFNKVFFVV